VAFGASVNGEGSSPEKENIDAEKLLFGTFFG
jgi:hypothetical protein